MAEAVVDLLEPVEVEIEHRYRASPTAFVDQPLRVLEEGRPVAEPGQGIAVGQLVRLRMGALVLDGDGAERHARLDDHPFERARVLAGSIVEGERSDRRSVARKDRARPARQDPVWNCQVTVVFPQRIGCDVCDVHLLPTVGGGTAGAGLRTDRDPVERGGILGGQRRPGQWAEEALPYRRAAPSRSPTGRVPRLCGRACPLPRPTNRRSRSPSAHRARARGAGGSGLPLARCDAPIVHKFHSELDAAPGQNSSASTVLRLRLLKACFATSRLDGMRRRFNMLENAPAHRDMKTAAPPARSRRRRPRSKDQGSTGRRRETRPAVAAALKKEAKHDA